MICQAILALMSLGVSSTIFQVCFGNFRTECDVTSFHATGAAARCDNLLGFIRAQGQADRRTARQIVIHSVRNQISMTQSMCEI